MAMKHHTIIYKEACTILSHRLIKLGKNFRYVVIKNGVDLAWMTSAATISRLCKFLVESTKVLIQVSSSNLIKHLESKKRFSFAAGSCCVQHFK